MHPLFYLFCFPVCSERFVLGWHQLVNVHRYHCFDFCDTCDELDHCSARRAMQEQTLLHRGYIARALSLLLE
jgi:hypothetical protein